METIRGIDGNDPSVGKGMVSMYEVVDEHKEMKNRICQLETEVSELRQVITQILNEQKNIRIDFLYICSQTNRLCTITDTLCTLVSNSRR
jgi:F0F1-type ATP synthase delta subunit